MNPTGAGGVEPGAIYVNEPGSRRVSVYGPAGNFIEMWGWNVKGVDEVQRANIQAEGGTYKLKFGAETTASLARNANATAVRNALVALVAIGPTDVAVTSSTSQATGQTLTFTFQNSLGGTDVEQLSADTSALTGLNKAGNPASMTFETLTTGAGGNTVAYEICQAAEVEICGPGIAPAAPLPIGAFSGTSGIAVDPADGSVYVSDRSARRVTKFSATGTPLFMVGRSVNQSSASALICPRPGFPADTCQTGAAGATGGAFATGESMVMGVGVAPPGSPSAGNFYVADSTNHRVQEFKSSGEWLRTFGWDVVPKTSANNLPRNEVQDIKVPATDGTFTLKFGANTTTPLKWNATPAEVATALNTLNSIKADSGSVSVTGGPGDATASTPYQVTFDGGGRADADVALLEANGRGLGTAPGTAVSCTTPTGATTTVKYQWLRNGVAVPGATAQTYTIQPADAGAAVQCQMTATNSAAEGRTSTQASYPAVNVTPLPVSPLRPIPPARLPTLTASFKPGQANTKGADGGYELHCATGAWQNSPDFGYQWYKNGLPLSGHGADTADYTTQAVDLKEEGLFQCAVTGTNASGSITLMSTYDILGNNDIDRSFVGPNSTPFPPSTVPSATQIPDVPTVQATTPGSNLEACEVATECRTGVIGTEVGQFGTNNQNPNRVAIDSTGAVYTVESGAPQHRVQKFTPQAAQPKYSASLFAPAFASGTGVTGTQPVDVAIGPSDTVLVQKFFPAGSTPCPNNSPSILERRVLNLSSDGSTLLSTDATCAGATSGTNDKGLAINTATGDLYVATDSGGDKILILGEGATDPEITLDDPEETATTAVLTGTVTPNASAPAYPNPPKASWQLQYKAASSGPSDWIKFRTPVNVGAGTDSVPYRITLTPLLPNTTYEVRAVATKEFNAGGDVSQVETLTTKKAPPTIVATQSSNVREDSADLNARIDPRGSETHYYFEWGPTVQYGNVTPITSIGDGQGPADATAHITGLSELSYYFRAVAENDAGKVVGENQVMTFHPPACPNALVRQQTGANYLPECRAYELVSPPRAGNSVIESFTGPRTGYATNPSRLAYTVQFAPLPESGDPTNTRDLYVATRGSNGWSNEYIGLPANESYRWGGPPGPAATAGHHMINVQVDPGLNKVLMWRTGNPDNAFYGCTACPIGHSNAPYLFDATGELIERWPTNLSSISEGDEFKAEVYQLVASGDLEHYYFSSDIPFIPGAAPTAIYHNDVEAGTLEVISKDSGGGDFVGYPVEVSTDGSHVLMSTATVPFCNDEPCPAIAPGTFYMRLNDQTYDVTEGHKGTFAGMTNSGSRVYFLSDEQVTVDDEDTSTDLFMWSDVSKEVTRVSAGISESAGNSDTCEAVESWTDKCSVRLIFNYERQCSNNCGSYSPKPRLFNKQYAHQIAGRGGARYGGTDGPIAPESGDFYFYSPEKLAGPTEGAEGMQNLYVFRSGAIQLVATFEPTPVCPTSQACATGPVGRMQVTANGDYAAFTSTAKLTSYDNAGLEVMYRYSAASGTVVCASCLPDGNPPNVRVEGSQNGLYLTENGAVFFATSDSLQREDTNGLQDVYEYVEGRPQLITQGTGESKIALCDACGLAQWSGPGLIGVSADGIDVYFATYDVLTAGDHNGGNLKIYNARTGGGYPVASVPEPCLAADECHGPSSDRPVQVPSGTGVDLGNRGNLAPTRPKKAQGKKRKCNAKGKNRKARNRRCRQRKQSQRKRARATRNSKVNTTRNAGRTHG